MEPEPPFFAWKRSRPNLVGAGVGSRDLGLLELEPPKKWRLRNAVAITVACRICLDPYPFSGFCELSGILIIFFYSTAYTLVEPRNFWKLNFMEMRLLYTVIGVRKIK